MVRCPMLQCLVKYQNKMLNAFYQRSDHALILIENFVEIYFRQKAIISRRVPQIFIWDIFGTLVLICKANLGIFMEYLKGIYFEKDWKRNQFQKISCYF